ncbi:hypothetical protein BKA70DRAFT_1450930 [Coprinopsis sp. MPI-PUGE-AT-0042]|nr:hypothetical protein BKA70DRAFT_1450930 [Coprinopsis sp. MPI-PUGE-AT-0042]
MQLTHALLGPQALIKKFLDYENVEVVSPHGQTHSATIRSFILQDTTEGLDTGSPPSVALLLSTAVGISRSTNKMTMLCRYLALLRVLDVASTLEGRQRHPKVSKWARNWKPASNPALALLPDIKKVLLKSQHALHNVLAPLDDLANSYTATSRMAPPFRIMRELARSIARTSGCSIVNNLLLASLHLSWLLAGKIDIPEAFSDDPSDWEELSDADKAQLSKLLAEEDSAYKIRLPLFYSLFVSPLVLLRTQCSEAKYEQDSPDRAIYIGNDKPPIISTMEKMVFTVLFGIATGTMSIKDGIESLLNHLPWDCIAALPEEVAAWFILPYSSTANASLSPHTLSSGDVDMHDGISASPYLASQTISNINTPLGPSTSIPPPLDQRGLGMLHDFAESIQSVATSSNIASAIPPGILALVALGALGIPLDAPAVEHLLGQLPSSHIASNAVAPSTSHTSPESAEIASPAIDLAATPLATLPLPPPPPPPPVIATPSPTPTSLGTPTVPPSPPSPPPPPPPPVIATPSSTPNSFGTPVAPPLPLPPPPPPPVVDVPLPPPSAPQLDPASLQPLYGLQLKLLGRQPMADPLDPFEPSSSPLSQLTDLYDIDDIGSQDKSSDNGFESEGGSIEEELDEMLTSDVERDSQRVSQRGSGTPSLEELPNIPALSDNLPGAGVAFEVIGGSKPKLRDRESLPRIPSPPPRKRPSRLKRSLAKSPAVTSGDDDQDPSVTRPVKKLRTESPLLEIPIGGVHLKAADMSQLGNTPDTAIVLDQIDDDVLRRLPPQTSARLRPSKSEKSHPPGMSEGETFYGPKGEATRWAPLFYDKSDAKGFVAWASAIKASFHGDQPRHVSDPDNSVFLITTEAEYRSFSIQERRDVWGKQAKLAIVLTECAGGHKMEFDKAALETLTGRIDAEIEVQDQSKSLGRAANISKARSRRTTLQEMLEYSQLPLLQRPIVNALTFPMPPGLRPEQKFPFSSEHIAWLRTLGNHFCFAPYPTSDTRWSLVAFNGALHYFHIDSDGFGTWVEVKHGKKLWVIARPKDESIPSFDNVDGFLKIFGDGSSPNTDYWTIEAVVLGPETRLIMAPNTVHAVWTMENSICYGGHFYSVPTLLSTVVGLIHAFIGEDFLTNTQHVASRFLLRRMVHFFHHAFVVQGISTHTPAGDEEHLPDLKDRDLFIATFALLSFIEMQNILDFRSYEYPETSQSSVWYGIAETSMSFCDVNGIPHEERLECIYTRGLATELAGWIFSHFSLRRLQPDGGTEDEDEAEDEEAEDEPSDPWNDFYVPYLAHFLQAVLAYKAKYPKAAPSRGCTLDLIETQIDRCIGDREELRRAFDAIDTDSIASISPAFSFSPVLRQKPLPFSRQTVEKLTSSGFRTGDKRYIEAYKEALVYQSSRRRSKY